MATFEIMLEDLTDKTQASVLKFLKHKSAQDGNLDVFPLFILER